MKIGSDGEIEQTGELSKVAVIFELNGPLNPPESIPAEKRKVIVANMADLLRELEARGACLGLFTRTSERTAAVILEICQMLGEVEMGLGGANFDGLINRAREKFPMLVTGLNPVGMAEFAVPSHDDNHKSGLGTEVVLKIAQAVVLNCPLEHVIFVVDREDVALVEQIKASLPAPPLMHIILLREKMEAAPKKGGDEPTTVQDMLNVIMSFVRSVPAFPRPHVQGRTVN